MKNRRNTVSRAFFGVVGLLTAVVILLQSASPEVAAGYRFADKKSAGAALIIDADFGMNREDMDAFVYAVNGEYVASEDDFITTGLVMANVKKVLYVRAEPTTKSEKVGKLYKDCGGMILERRDGWTRIVSGDLVGWCSDQFLLYGTEAEEMAADVGVVWAVVESEGLYVRAEASLESDSLGLLTNGDILEVIGDYSVEDEWILVDFEGQDAYLYNECVSINLEVDAGETMAAIEEREQLEREERRKKYKDVLSYTEGLSDLDILAAIVFCEAGNQPMEGKIAVASVVMNRVKSSGYPDTVAGVIGASGQFTPVASGFFYKVIKNKRATKACYEAAQRAMDGEKPVGNATHFRRAGKRQGTIIGAHVFY